MRIPGGLWPRRRRLLVDAIQVASPDVIGLQEVAAGALLDGTSQVEQLARMLGYRWSYLPVSQIGSETDPYSLGLGVLARHPIRGMSEIGLPASETQAACHAIIKATMSDFDLIVVHLTPRKEESRLAAIERIRQYLSDLPADRLVVVVGDFNATPTSRTVETMLAAKFCDTWSKLHPTDAGATMPSHAPTDRIDFIFTRGMVQPQCAELIGTSWDSEGFYPSDHLGVVTTLELR